MVDVGFDILYNPYMANKFEILDNNSVKVYDGKERSFIIDPDDWEIYKEFSWVCHYDYKKKDYYVRSQINGKTVSLHRLIMKVTNRKLQIDHINNISLDNRKENLRIVTPRQNMHNRKKPYKYGISGIDFHKAVGKFRVRMNIGYFDTLEEAIETRKKAEEFFSPDRRILEK
jgi:hypothetical protein